MSSDAIERLDGPLTLQQLDALRKAHGAAPVGFIVSTELHELLKSISTGDAAFIKADPVGGGETFSGLPIVVDPAMPPDEFEIAFSAEAWRDRLRSMGKSG